MKDNNLSIKLNVDRESLIFNEDTLLTIEIKNESENIISNTLLKVFIDNDDVFISENKYNLKGNTFIIIGDLEPFEVKIMNAYLDIRDNCKSKDVCVHSLLNYQIQEDRRASCYNIKSNYLNLSIESNSEHLFKEEIYSLNRSCEALLEDEKYEVVYSNDNGSYLNLKENSIENNMIQENYKKDVNLTLDNMIREELRLPNYSIEILDTLKPEFLFKNEEYTYFFDIRNNGDMHCKKCSVKINLPNCFKYIENSTYMNDSLINIESLNHPIIINNIGINETIRLDFEFEVISIPLNNIDFINIEIESEFLSYKQEMVHKSLNYNLQDLKIGNLSLKEFEVDSEYRLRNNELPIAKILDIKNSCCIDSFNQVKIVKNKVYQTNRSIGKDIAVKGYISHIIKYEAYDNSICTINKKTPFTTVLKLEENCDLNKRNFKVMCEKSSYSIVNKKTLVINNLLSIK